MEKLGQYKNRYSQFGESSNWFDGSRILISPEKDIAQLGNSREIMMTDINEHVSNYSKWFIPLEGTEYQDIYSCFRISNLRNNEIFECSYIWYMSVTRQITWRDEHGHSSLEDPVSDYFKFFLFIFSLKNIGNPKKMIDKYENFRGTWFRMKYLADG